MFYLKNREFTFDVDVSELPCGLNGALYFVEMHQDGGLSEYETNEGGAAYGTGYCDAQCPHDLKFINGETNSEEWKPSDNDANAGKGHYGSCCFEMDIWECNTMATAYTHHPSILWVRKDVRGHLVETMTQMKGMTGSAIKMAATSTAGDSAIKPSLVQDPILSLTL